MTPDGDDDGDADRYVVEADGEPLAMEPYRRGANAYLRWEHGDRSGRRGGVTADGRFVGDVDAFVDDRATAETLPLPEDVHADVLDDLRRLREAGVREELGQDAAEAFEEDKRVFERAREILEAGEDHAIDDFATHEVELTVGDRALAVTLQAVEHRGLAEVRVTADELEGFAPHYDLDAGELTLPAMGEWGFTSTVAVPDDVATALLDDLTTLQEQLNARREAYDDAVERARDEVSSE